MLTVPSDALGRSRPDSAPARLALDAKISASDRASRVAAIHSRSFPNRAGWQEGAGDLTGSSDDNGGFDSPRLPQWEFQFMGQTPKEAGDDSGPCCPGSRLPEEAIECVDRSSVLGATVSPRDTAHRDDLHTSSFSGRSLVEIQVQRSLGEIQVQPLNFPRKSSDKYLSSLDS